MRSEGKFSPALDSDGKPTKVVLAAKFRWSLPGEEREGGEGVSVAPDPGFPMGEPVSATLSVLVGAVGRVQDCHSGSAACRDSVCQYVMILVAAVCLTKTTKV